MPSPSLSLQQPQPLPLIRPVDLSAAILCQFCPYLACSTDGSPSPSYVSWRRRGCDRRRPLLPLPCRPCRCLVFPPGWSIPLLLLLFLLLLILVLVLLLPFDVSVFPPRRRPRRGRTHWGGLGTTPSRQGRRLKLTGRRGRRGRGSNLHPHLHLQLPPPPE